MARGYRNLSRLPARNRLPTGTSEEAGPVTQGRVGRPHGRIKNEMRSWKQALKAVILTPFLEDRRFEKLIKV